MMIILWCMLSVPESYPVEKVIWGQRLSSDDSILDICYLLTNQVGGEKFAMWRIFNLPCVMIVENLKYLRVWSSFNFLHMKIWRFMEAYLSSPS